MKLTFVQIYFPREC